MKGRERSSTLEIERETVFVQRQAVAQAKLDEAVAKQGRASGAVLGHRAALNGHSPTSPTRASRAR